MKTAHTLLLFALALVSLACEETVDSSEVPYVERVLVQGLLVAGDSNSVVSFTRTLPLNSTYSIETAALQDVVATITVDGVSHHLHHVSFDRYAPEDLTIESGKTYELKANWHGHSLSALTTVPYPGSIDTVITSDVDQGPYGGYYTVTDFIVTPASPAAYLASFVSRRRPDSLAVKDTDWFYEQVQLRDVQRYDVLGDDGKVHVRRNYGRDYWSPTMEVRAILYSFDPAFYEYARSVRDDNNDGAFSTGGHNPNWNIQGDGIGYLFGEAVSTRIIQ